MIWYRIFDPHGVFLISAESLVHLTETVLQGMSVWIIDQEEVTVLQLAKG